MSLPRYIGDKRYEQLLENEEKYPSRLEYIGKTFCTFDHVLVVDWIICLQHMLDKNHPEYAPHPEIAHNAIWVYDCWMGKAAMVWMKRFRINCFQYATAALRYAQKLSTGKMIPWSYFPPYGQLLVQILKNNPYAYHIDQIFNADEGTKADSLINHVVPRIDPPTLFNFLSCYFSGPMVLLPNYMKTKALYLCDLVTVEPNTDVPHIPNSKTALSLFMIAMDTMHPSSSCAPVAIRTCVTGHHFNIPVWACGVRYKWDWGTTVENRMREFFLEENYSKDDTISSPMLIFGICK